MRTLPKYLIASLCALGLALTGCASSDRTEVSAVGMTDAEMERSIHTRWALNPDLKDLDVSANAKNNEATLTGTVVSQSLRTEAVDLAKAVSPGLIVTDKIDVKPHEVTLTEYTEDMAREAREKAKVAGEKIGNSLEDAWIHTKVSAKLIADSTTPAHKINVDVTNNVVTLRGTVQSATEKAEAERIAKETSGVKRVVNRLAVGLS